MPTSDQNEALWLTAPGGAFEVRPAPMPTPGPGELVVRVHAVAVNPVDAIRGPFRRLVSPWVRYPAVLGSDVAGVVTATGDGVTAATVGDRVVAFAAGGERARNTPAEGAFQRFVIVLDRVTARIPDATPFADAAVLPLGLATAAAGLFEADQLALPIPESARDGGGTVLVWGASTSVGCNAVQLAVATGHRVVATAGERNHDLVRGLGADAVIDYRDSDIDRRVIAALGDDHLVGTIAIGRGSLSHALRIAAHTTGTRRIASAYPDPLTKTRALLARTRRIHVSTIWGGTPVVSPVGPAVFRDFLPKALTDGRFRAAPKPVVVGDGLDSIPVALARLRAGVSAAKLVVTVDAAHGVDA